MVTMDLKGITWVGHVYQKFETMCLEVEEIMYQDTVKYVEDQVQTVGESVKKLYSEVMQDFLPPSSMDLVKGAAASNFPTEKNADVGICKKPKVGMKEETVKVDNEQLSEDSQAAADVDNDARHGPSSHGMHIKDTLFHSSSRKCNNGACPDLYSKRYSNRSMHNKSRLGAKRISKKENLPPSEMSGAIAHTQKDLNRASSFHQLLDKNQEALSNQIAISPTPVTAEATENKSTEELCDEFGNAGELTPGVLTDSPSSTNRNESENSSARSSLNEAAAELNAADICTSNGVVSPVGPSVIGSVQPSEFADKVIFVCRPGPSDDSTTNTMESSNAVEQGFKAIQQIDNIQVEESCVLVNGDELHFVPHNESKHRPYKKKIRNAISSRMRSARKQEYEQLAVWYGGDVKSNQESVQSSMPCILTEDTKSSLSHDNCEFEWELL